MACIHTRRHTCADDTLIHGSWLAATQGFRCRCLCIDEVRSRCGITNKICINAGKTEVVWFATSQQYHELPQISALIIVDYISCANSVCYLGIYIDSMVSMRSHIPRTMLSYFATLRQIRIICWRVPRQLLLSLVIFWTTAMLGVSPSHF